MYVECGNNLVGIRAVCNPSEPPKSGLYLEDLVGITAQKASETAEDKTGIELMQNALKLAQIHVNSDILMHVDRNSDVKGKNLNLRSFLAPFFNNFQNRGNYVGTANESLYVSALHKTGLTASRYWNIAKIELGTLYIEPSTDIIDFTITITDKESDRTTDRVRTINLGNLAGGILNQIPVLDDITGKPIEINGLDFNVSTASLDGVTVKQTQLLDGYKCSGCGGRWKWIQNEYFRFSSVANFTGGALGSFFVTLNGLCSPENLLCYVYNYPYWATQLGQLIWYKAGATFFEEVIASNRENFYIQNTQNTEYDRQRFELKYNDLKTFVFQNITNRLIESDKICYQCGGWTQSQLVS